MDTNTEVTGFHDSAVTLLQTERTEMRDRRDSNRNRVKQRLKAVDKPTPSNFISQGSYVDKTMVQYPNKDYDIDDGVYFLAEDLVGPNGAPYSSLAARKMVQDALNDGSFKVVPQLHANCVRVIYNLGYNVDVPVYRLVAETDFFGNITKRRVELASTDWVASEPALLKPWFDGINQTLSPDITNGRQFRRVVRLIKFFASSRSSWRERILSGFGITILASRCYVPFADRDDQSLIFTMRAMIAELNGNLEIRCPVPPYDVVTSSTDAKAAFFRDKLAGIEGKLDDLEAATDKAISLKLWSAIFYHSYFSDKILEEAASDNVLKSSASSGASTEKIHAAAFLADMQSDAENGEVNTDKLLELIWLGIAGQVDWGPIQEMARTCFNQAVGEESKGVARINFYQISLHRGFTLTPKIKEEIRETISRFPTDDAFKLCGNILLGSATKEMVINCINSGHGSGVLNWPIMELVPHEFRNV